MNCWHCKAELIWNSDFDFEDYGLEEEGIVTHLSCPECPANVDVYLPSDEG
tara:strand:+ start:2952 stop:3104 length:153 start_codon:yes stop_codon:yes gene_type:complete